MQKHFHEIATHGYMIIPDVFTEQTCDELIGYIEKAGTGNNAFRKSADLFAIRRFHKEIPEVLPAIFNHKIVAWIKTLFGSDYFITKSIYFDKPVNANWFVPYHQDLTISVDQKQDIQGYGPWSVKQDQFTVQPPADILEHNFTIRIHLDDTDEHNGALKVILGSHLKGISRAEATPGKETEQVCRLKKGDIMIMRPLLLHASGRTTNGQKRRVIHVELSNRQLPVPLKWSEYHPLNF